MGPVRVGPASSSLLSHNRLTGPSAVTLTARIVEVASYPFLIILGCGLYFLLVWSEVGAVISAGISVSVSLGLITLHEIRFPYRPEWKPTFADVRGDIAFMFMVKILLPLILLATVSTAVRDSGLVFSNPWPHDLPIAVQVAMMLLIVELVHYWYHRASHKLVFIWRFHAVHHSPHRLYSLRALRFHPFDETMKHIVDVLPFVALAVVPEVVYGHFVVVAITGFFQHSNCRVKLGPLNYVINGPELHRWHHSELVQESDHNYGNALIIWDVIFKTRFLPQGRDVGPIGLVNRSYPMGYLRQMVTPFIRDLDKRPPMELAEDGSVKR